MFEPKLHDLSQNVVSLTASSGPIFSEPMLRRMMSYALEERGEEDLAEAWQTFRVWLDETVDPHAPDWSLFRSWYLFHWQGSGTRVPVAHMFANKYAKSEVEHALFAAGTKSPLDFYEIHELPEPDCYYVKSLLLGFRHSFAVSELPRDLKAGDILMGHIIPLEADNGMFAGYSQPLDRSAKYSIARLRLDLISRRKVDFIEKFGLFESDLLNLYYDLIHT